MGRTGIGPQQQLLLDQFGQLIEAAWGETGYLVGSSQRGERNWRDIDVRVMLSNDEYARRLGPIWQDGMRHRDLAWRAHMLAWSTLGERMTGLPIDFQVERLSEANAKHLDEPRNPIGVTLRAAQPGTQTATEVELSAIPAALPLARAQAALVAAAEAERDLCRACRDASRFAARFALCPVHAALAPGEPKPYSAPCPKCDGRGFTREVVEGSRESDKCRWCHGGGVVPGEPKEGE